KGKSRVGRGRTGRTCNAQVNILMVEQRDKLKNLCAPSRSAYRTCYESRAQRRYEPDVIEPATLTAGTRQNRRFHIGNSTAIFLRQILVNQTGPVRFS